MHLNPERNQLSSGAASCCRGFCWELRKLLRSQGRTATISVKPLLCVSCSSLGEHKGARRLRRRGLKSPSASENGEPSSLLRRRFTGEASDRWLVATAKSDIKAPYLCSGPRPSPYKLIPGGTEHCAALHFRCDVGKNSSLLFGKDFECVMLSPSGSRKHECSGRLQVLPKVTERSSLVQGLQPGLQCSPHWP